MTAQQWRELMAFFFLGLAVGAIFGSIVWVMWL